MSEETPPHHNAKPDDDVRRIARELKVKYGTVAPGELEADESFLAAVELLADDAVDDETVARLARDSGPFIAAIGCEAIRRRGTAPAGWEKKALRRLAQAAPEEARFHLRALAAASRQNLIPRVLGTARESWVAEPVAAAAREFLTARIEAGERVHPNALAEHLSVDALPTIGAILDGADDSVREAVEPAVSAWRRSLIEPEFFDQFARFVEPTRENTATLVGNRSAIVDAVVAAVTARQSVLLVGEHGVGKSTLTRTALARLGPEWLAIEAGASDVMAGQTFIGELEGRLQEIAQRAAGQPLVWLFPRFEEGIWSGQHYRSPRGLFDALLPHLEDGRLIVVGELEPAAYETATQLRPRIKTAFELVRVPPLSEDDTVAVCGAWLERTGLSVREATVREAYDLALHYLAGAAPPGDVLRLLKATVDRRERLGETGEIAGQDLLATLSEATGLPLDVLDPRAPLDVDAMRAFFEDRVLGQPEAVQTLVERIAMVKAGLTDPTRPLGVFLFVGPTGTGKTEIAKALAEFLFGSPDKLVRVDMSEYQTPEGFERLLGESTSGDPQGPTLASAVRKDPFSVVLLDEFEKAHPNVWNLFLQVFDDGRLTDSAGHTADFRHCVIILTSNLGSAIPTRPALGFAGEERRFEAAAVEKEVEASFRPELLNRLDRIVVFRPLDRSVMRAILEQELSSVLRRRGFRIHPWAVESDDAALDFLLERGFSEKFGARPLKRAVEQHLLAPLALAIVGRRFPEGDQFLFITASGDRIDVAFVGPDDDADQPLPPADAAPERLEPLILEPRGDVGEIRFLGDRMKTLRDRIGGEAWQEEKDAALALIRDAGFWESEGRQEVLGRIEYLDRIEAAMGTADGLLRRLTEGRRSGRPTKLISLLAERVYLLERALEGLDSGEAADAHIRINPAAGVEAEDDARAFVRDLGEMYVAWASRRGMRIEPVEANGVSRSYAVSGIAAYTILRPETGLHVLELPEGHRSYSRVGVHVTVTPAPWDGASASDGAGSGSRAVVRRYRRDPSPLVRDSVRGWRTGRLDRVLGGEFDVLI